MTKHDEPGKYLNALAFRATPDLVGDACVFVRDLDEATAKLWDDFDFQCKRRYGNDSAQAPYSIATTVLKVLTGGYVYFDPDKRAPFLASREPLDDRLLERVFTLTYHLASGAAIETINLSAPPVLASRIAATPQVERHLAEHLAPTSGRQPTAPGWVFRTIGWDISRTLATRHLKISETRQVKLRPDTGGGLVAIDTPWENEQGGRFALSRTALRLKTMPNIQSPILQLTSHVTRIDDSLVFASTALAVPRDEQHPILQISLNGRGGARTVNRLALEALGRLEMDYSILRTIDERSRREQKLLAEAREKGERIRFARERPGQVWPVLGRNVQFPIGTGVGMHHLRKLHEHVETVFDGKAVPLVMREVAMSLPHRPTDPETVSKEELERRKQEKEETGSKDSLRPRGSAFPSAESIVACIEAAGFKKLRIVCLWYRDETRLRMLKTLADTYGLPTTGLDPVDGQEIELHGRAVTAVFCAAQEFLSPGRAEGRARALEPIRPVLALDEATTVVAAWCETEFPRPEHAEQEQAGAEGLDELDAKHQTRAVLARLGIPTQYLLGRTERGVVHVKKDDHPAEMALLDLYRSLGIIDDRIANALKPEKDSPRVDDLAHVGIYVRQQNRRKDEEGSPKVVITATAVVPPADPEGVWTMLGWSTAKPEWQSYRTAQTSFHARAYPEPGEKRTYRQRWDEAADDVERALRELAEELDGTGYVVTVDELAARRMWSGLQNVCQGADRASGKSKYWLPGSSLQSDQRPKAVVRINLDDEEVPQPVSSSKVTKAGTTTDYETAQTLFRVETDFATPVWILCNVPRAYRGSGGRLGAKYTRWEAKKSVQSQVAAERRKGEMPQNWYSMTATEIYPIAFDPRISREALAVAAAKLCHQAQFWSDRSRYPVPLHAAKQMDLDHPQYRRTAQEDPTPAAEPETAEAVDDE